MSGFKDYQSYLSSPSTVLFAEWLMMLSVFGLVAASSLHWFLNSHSLQLPTSIVIFYFVKLLSDTSLTLSKPSDIIWQPTTLFGLIVTDDTFFHANVDVFCGLIIISTIYLLKIGDLTRG